MADLLQALQTARKEVERPEPCLSEISKTLRQTRSVGEQNQKFDVTDDEVESPENILRILRSQPSLESLMRALEQITNGFAGSKFNISIPGSQQAQIINTLVNYTLPDFWSTLSRNNRGVFLHCLRNVAGLSAIIARLRHLADQKKSRGHELGDVLSVAKELLEDDRFCLRLWNGLFDVHLAPADHQSVIQRQMVWKEFVGLVASGKVVAIVAYAEDHSRTLDSATKPSWMANGSHYAKWLGRNIAHLITGSAHGKGTMKRFNAAVAMLICKAFTLGYPIALVKTFIGSLLLQSDPIQQAVSAWGALLEEIPLYTKRQLQDSTLRWLSTLADSNCSTFDTHVKSVSAIAAVIHFVCGSDESMAVHLTDFLQDPVVSSSVSYYVKRGSIAFLSAHYPDRLDDLLEKSIGAFGDQLFINHAPSGQQESLAQTLLMTAAYVHRKTPMAVLMAARSSSHMQGISNRLDSSNQRARWLGMVVATGLSTLIDKTGSRINFDTEDMLTKEAQWYQGLVNVNDANGSLAEIDSFLNETLKPSKSVAKVSAQNISESLPVSNVKQMVDLSRTPHLAQTEVIGDKIAEILNVNEDEDDDLKPYAKPDSDPEDSDEDATLVNRNKPRPPVYIRELMKMLKDDKNHDRFQIAVKHAPTLIRKKSSFGTEVKDHAEELALMLSDLQDPFRTEEFDELKLQALIAVLLSDVATIAPWLSKQAFVGDYSLGQRCTMLSALGLGGRELAGFNERGSLNPSLSGVEPVFPSKRLPVRLHTLYDPANNSVKQLHAASQDMQHQLIKPLALSAADQETSHLNAVKVRTFSSRIDVGRTKRKPEANQLATVFASYFFFPLVTRYQDDVAAYGSGSVFKSASFVLVTFLKTLALLLHASGPATIDLADVTTIFWKLTLSLRVQASADVNVLETTMFCFLTILEVNGNAKDRMAQDNTRELEQTQQWAEVVFQQSGGAELNLDGSKEEIGIRTLAAGVLVKISEIIQERQKKLMGDLR